LPLIHYAPFYLPSYLFWIGIVLTLAGLISCLQPLRFLLISSRRAGIAVFVCGLLLSTCGMFWPEPYKYSNRPRQRIDDFLPTYSFFERHETLIRAKPEQVLRAARRVSMADMPVARFIMRLRQFAGGEKEDRSTIAKPILELFSQPGSGFITLDAENPNEYVGALAGRPWRSEAPPKVTTPREFMVFKTPGHVKVAFNFHAQDRGNGQTLLSTETRIAGNDARARRIFGRYWRVIYPGSAIIRRLWLDAIAALAEKPALPPLPAAKS
jgi:hypothetical protein